MGVWVTDLLRVIFPLYPFSGKYEKTPMKTIELPIDMLHEAPWNPNRMDAAAVGRLAESVRRFGLVQPLVVRPMAKSEYEVINGNQRLRILQDAGIRKVLCAVVDLDDTGAMLLAEALNGIHGDDDLALKGALLKKVLSTVPPEKVLSLPPETADSLEALSAIGEDDLAEHLEAWQKARQPDSDICRSSCQGSSSPPSIRPSTPSWPGRRAPAVSTPTSAVRPSTCWPATT